MAIYVNEDFLKDVGLRIKKIRKEKKLSQGDLAIKIESHRSVVRAIEKGESNAYINTILAITKVLEVDDANEIISLKF